MYRAILSDFILEETRIRGLIGGPFGEEGGVIMPKDKISLSICGHSLGLVFNLIFYIYVMISVFGYEMVLLILIYLIAFYAVFSNDYHASLCSVAESYAPSLLPIQPNCYIEKSRTLFP